MDRPPCGRDRGVRSSLGGRRRSGRWPPPSPPSTTWQAVSGAIAAGQHPGGPRPCRSRSAGPDRSSRSRTECPAPGSRSCRRSHRPRADEQSPTPGRVIHQRSAELPHRGVDRVPGDPEPSGSCSATGRASRPTWTVTSTPARRVNNTRDAIASSVSVQVSPRRSGFSAAPPPLHPHEADRAPETLQIPVRDRHPILGLGPNPTARATRHAVYRLDPHCQLTGR